MGLISRGQSSVIDSLLLHWEYYKLPNGIQVILQPDAKQTEISVEFWVGVGARDEKQGKFGFAHFFEHATPYGLRNDTIAQKALAAQRTNSNAQTRKDYTRYYVQVKPAGLELALKYSADRLKADTSAITSIISERHKKNVLSEMSRQEASPLYGPTATTARETATFGSQHAYGHSSYGSVFENENFTNDEIKTWYEQYFFTDNIVLFIVGNFDAEKTKSLIEKEFGPVQRKGNRIKKDKFSPTTSTHPISIVVPVESHFLSVTWNVAAWGSKDDPALQLLAEIAEDRLIKSAPAGTLKQGSKNLFNLYEWGGQFGVFASFSSLVDSNTIENYLYKTVTDIIQNGVTEEELANARLKTIESVKKLSMNLGFIASRTEMLGEGLLFINNPGYYHERLRKQVKLSAKDIQKVAAKWLKNKGARVLLISNK
jgi:predicted Zn-dependent peptidase